MNDSPSLPVLALNAGSSSIKFGLYVVGASVSRILVSGAAETDGNSHRAFIASDADGNVLAKDATSASTPRSVIGRIAELLSAHRLPAPVAVGHRIVHGGPDCRRHTLIDAKVMKQLEAAAVFAPLHVPPALTLVRFAQERFPGIPQAACLDTAFHAGMPDVALTLPIPRELRSQGIERYGFHGLSCESIVRQLGSDMARRMVIAHLGHGASVTAVASGQSIDTSMGLTPTGGVIMSTRCGDIDPGVLAYVIREQGYDAARFESLIDQRSGLYGISSLSGDMRVLRAATTNEDARLAIAMFCYSVRKQIAAMAAALGGLDLLVFTGGIGENDAATRASICKELEWLVSRTSVRVLPSREEEQIALHTWQLTTGPSPAPGMIATTETPP
ncbi:MAG: acetate kinase [Betaproteobacteria bacterium]